MALPPADALRLAREQRVAGRPAEALAILLPVLERAPRHVGLLFEEASCHWARHEHGAARGALERLLAVQPGHPNGLILRLRVAAASEEVPAALARAAQTAARLPEAPAPRAIQARLLRLAGQVEAAQAVLSGFLDTGAAPGHAECLLEMARCHQALGQDGAALAIIERMLETQPTHKAAVQIGLQCATAQQDTAATRRYAGRLAVLLGDAPPGARAFLANPLAQLLCHVGAARQDGEWSKWLEVLCGAAADVAAPQLWRLHRLADLAGLEHPSRALLEALLARRDLGLAIAREVLHAAHAADGAAMDGVAPRLRDALATDAIPGFDLAHAALRDGAVPALAGRRRVAARGAQEVPWLHALLLEAGRRTLALRYLRRACHAHAANAALRERWVLALISAGEVETARHEVERLRADPGALGDKAPAIIARALLALGEAEAALRQLDALPPQESLARLRFQALMRLGRTEEAEAALRIAPGDPTSRRRLHRNATLDGQRLTEHRLGADGDGPADAAQFVGPAIQEIDAWLARPPELAAGSGGPPAPIPRVIMQYWDTGHPPPALHAIIESWRSAPGFEHALFSQRDARHFLLRHLGPEWEAALRLARHPAEESDYFRLCFLLVRGGVYADCDDRLLRPLDPLLEGRSGLVAFQEPPTGVIGNNLLLASPRNPVLAQAAIAARQALARRDNDSPWAKTGPGLLTRMVAGALRDAAAHGTDPGVRILPQHMALRCVQMHVPLAYKRTGAYWNRSARGSPLAGLGRALQAPGQA